MVFELDSAGANTRNNNPKHPDTWPRHLQGQNHCDGVVKEIFNIKQSAFLRQSEDVSLMVWYGSLYYNVGNLRQLEVLVWDGLLSTDPTGDSCTSSVSGLNWAYKIWTVYDKIVEPNGAEWATYIFFTFRVGCFVHILMMAGQPKPRGLLPLHSCAS